MRTPHFAAALLVASASLLSGCSSFQIPDSVAFWRSAPMPVEQPAPPSVTHTLSGRGEGLNAALDQYGELRYAVESENFARDQSCAAEPHARLLDKGPGYETYELQCTARPKMVVRCDFSYCRALS